MKVFCTRLKELRIAKGETLKDVANAIGISLMAYAHYEYGDSQPSLELVAALCKHFEVSSDYLLGLCDFY